MADDASPELVRDVEAALVGVNFADDSTLWHTFEALHDLSHTLGDIYSEQAHEFMERVRNVPEHDAGTIREMVAEWDGAMRLRFVAWMREHGVPFLRWWVLHSTGVYLLWEIHAD